MAKSTEVSPEEEIATEAVESADSFETKPTKTNKPPVMLASKKKTKVTKKQ